MYIISRWNLSGCLSVCMMCVYAYAFTHVHVCACIYMYCSISCNIRLLHWHRLRVWQELTSQRTAPTSNACSGIVLCVDFLSNANQFTEQTGCFLCSTSASEICIGMLFFLLCVCNWKMNKVNQHLNGSFTLKTGTLTKRTKETCLWVVYNLVYLSHRIKWQGRIHPQ